jgi:hypothetical protein
MFVSPKNTILKKLVIESLEYVSLMLDTSKDNKVTVMITTTPVSL